MANPQADKHFTRIANELLEHLAEPGLNGSELRMVIFIFRKTYGFNKKVDKIPLSQLSRGLKMDRSNVCQTMKSLVAKRLLDKSDKGLSINKNWEEWVVAKRLHSGQKHNGVVAKSIINPVAKRLPSKDIAKDINSKDILASSQSSDAEEIKKVFEIFQTTVNPVIKYGNKTQRRAAEELIKSLGIERAVKLTQYAVSIQGEAFAPVITTPWQLQQKLAQVRIYYQKNNQKLTSERVSRV